MKKYKSLFQNEFEEDFCYRCGKYNPTDWHHIFNASNKKKSEQYGAMIKVCRDCHNVIHEKEMNDVKKMGQEFVMAEYDMSVDEFRSIFGRNYL